MKKETYPFLLALCLLLFSNANSQSSIYLKLDGVEGTVLHKDYKGWIQVTGLEQSASNTVVFGGGGGAVGGRARLTEFRIRKAIDKTSPLLLLHTSSGKHLPKATIAFAGFDGTATYTINLTDVILTGVTTVADCTPGCKTNEQVLVSFAKAEWTFKDKTGAITKGGWDTLRNLAF